MCVNPFSPITGLLFAYTGHNESLIHRCHLQPAVTPSRINSWSSRRSKKQRSWGAWAFLYLFHSKQQIMDQFMCWEGGCFLMRLLRRALWCMLFLIVFCIFIILLSLIIPPTSCSSVLQVFSDFEQQMIFHSCFSLSNKVSSQSQKG